MKSIAQLFISLLLLIIVSCKPDKKEEIIKPETPSLELKLNFSHFINNKALDHNSIFTTNSGTKFTVDILRYYLSNFVLIQKSGEEVPLKNSYLLINPDKSQYSIKDVPKGEYIGIKFGVGIDSITNHSDPTVHKKESPLAMQTPNMYWTWKSGYIFLSFEGSCDTTIAQSDSPIMGRFKGEYLFHIGNDWLYKNVSLSLPKTLLFDESKEINIEVDLTLFFDGIDLKTENFTHSSATDNVSKKVAKNIPNMFKFSQ
ncbi:MAG: hypothetical protein EAZ07_00355 [Cytophagales bacterium]|nr:MAG: hypothetical protein EAZ07_00355 [Cytophagales bacterium]